MRSVIDEIAYERRRQIGVEGWTAEYDDAHRRGELANAAACYAATEYVFFAEERLLRGYKPFPIYRDLWPWPNHWWKPKDRRRDLIRAAALIVAEIERFDRAELAKLEASG